MSDLAHTTIDPAEIERFSRIAAEWWDPAGKFAPLHRLNPVRIGYIRDQAALHWQRDPLSGSPLTGLSVLDIGCGGGLLCEPMVRLGANVTGLDASERNIRVAALHAEGQALSIDYRQDTAEACVATGRQYDIVLALEIVDPGGPALTPGARAAVAEAVRAAIRIAREIQGSPGEGSSDA